ncbi:MAG: hypothetical protein JEY99_10615 [Spirochaetales bacterium]|nr:hypothetical protein [Spirochaetales bacterium]
MKMKRISMLLILGIALITLISGCDLFSNEDEITDEIVNQLLEEAESIQPLLPVFTAAQNLYVPEATSPSASISRTLNTSTTTSADATWTDQTPSEVMRTSTGVELVGEEENLLTDLNGSTGDDYYFKLSLYGANPAAYKPGDGNLYKVELYVYPTTSPSVHYIREEYLVSDSDTWGIVDTAGEYSPISFIRYETHYYDGTIDYRNFVWSSNITTNYYAASDLFDITDDDAPADAAADYDYPVDPATENKPTESTGDFSILVSGTIPATNTNFYEYYGEYPVGGSSYKDRRSVSYLFTDLSSDSIDGSEKTVRRSYYDVDAETKKIRSKTVTTMTIGSLDIVKTTIESVDIDLANGTYDSTVSLEKVIDGGTPTTTTTVTELTTPVGASTGTYSGTVSVTTGSTETTYTTALSTTGGLTLTDDASGNPVVEEGYIPVALEEGEQLITVDIPDGGTIDGILTSGRINGLINSGKAADVIIGPTYVQVIYTTNGSSNKKTK